MEGRFARAAGAVSFSIFVVLAIFEVQGWIMPGPLAVGLVILMGLMGVIALAIALQVAWKISAPYRSGWRLRFPVYNIHSSQGIREEQDTSQAPKHQGAPDWALSEIDRLLVTSIEQVIFSGLWNSSGNPHSEPSIEFIVKVVNNSPWYFLVHGVENRATISRDACTMDMRWPSGGRVAPLRSGNFRMQQPFLTEKGKELLVNIERGDSVEISLVNVFLKGQVEGVGQDLPRRGITGSFNVEMAGVDRAHATVEPIPSTFRRQ